MRHFAKDERGSMAVLFGVIATVLLGCAALAVDVPNAYRVQARLQTAADAAATAAVLDLPNATTATAKALDLAAKNAPAGFGTITTASDVVFGTYDSATRTFSVSSSNINAIRVFARRTSAKGNPVPTFLAKVLGQNSGDIVASATAVRIRPTACFIALRTTGSGLTAEGGGTVSVPNCGIHVNSSDAAALSVNGHSSVTAQSICVVGGVAATVGGVSPTPRTGCAVMADPLASLPEPPVPATCSTTNYNNGGMNATIDPGTYCGTFTATQGTVTLNPGQYYFKASSVVIGSSANLAGSGVMLFFDAASVMSHTSSGTMNVSAPTSGTYAGVVIFQSRSAINKTVRLSGDVDFAMNGTIYVPSSRLHMTGSSTLTNNARSGYVIASHFQYSGSSAVTFDTGLSARGLSNGAALVY